MMRLDGKIVVITGAMGALGQTVASVFSTSGATLVVVDRQVPKELPGGMLGLTADVTDAAEVQRLMETVTQKAGRIDCLVNLVGGFSMGRVTETDRSLWDKMLTMNLTSAFLLSRAVVPHMLEQRSGRIIHIAARAALDPFPGAAAYLVAKSALLSLVRIRARKLVVPYPILLVIGGLTLALVPGLPTIRLDPDLVFLVFLPPILWSAAYFTSLREFRKNLRPISLLAVGLVAATTASVAVVTH